jgi:hypothetical protein
MENKQEQFVEKSIKTHGDKYDYSNVKYVNSSTNVSILCKKHNYEFKQNPDNHIRGANCPKCALEERSNKRKMPIEDFLIKANIKHSNKFDYSKVSYKNSQTTIIIICPVHGEFAQIPYSHLNTKFGCNKCAIKDSATNRTKDTDIFLKELKEIFGDKFDYSKVNYINTNTDIILICKKHNKEFKMIPVRLLKSKLCCPDCVIDNKKICNSKPLDEFIEEAHKKHNNKFDYSKVIYKNCDTDIIIICPEHGELNMTPQQHLRSIIGCIKCSGSYKKNKEEFIEEAIKIHGNRYEYSKIEFINLTTNVIIFCKKHNKEFIQIPSNHLRGSKCKTCSDEDGSEKRRYTKDEFIKMAKEANPNNLDDYTILDYINLSTPINIKCKIHGEYIQLPNDHIRGHRCSKCAKDKLSLLYRLPLEEFIKISNEKHNNYYDYTQTEYINNNTKVKIICPKHGIFLQIPSNHMGGSICKRCMMNGCSKVQIEWLKYLENELSLIIEHHENGGEHRIKNKNKKRYSADGYCKNLNTIFEFQGCYYHGCKTCMPTGINRTCKKTFEELYDKTQKKKEHCINEGYNYIEIWECEWNKIKKKDELLNNYISNLIDINNYLITNNEIII